MASPDSTFVKRYRLPILELFRRHPVISAIIIFAIDVAIELIVGLFAKSLVPPIPMLPDFIALCVLVVGVIALVTFLGWWKVVGCNPPSEWRNLALLLLPTVLVFLPLLGGFKAVDAGTVVFLLVGYLLTGFHEETLHRGVILRVLQPTGVWPSVLISSLLFGLAHSANLFLHFSGSPVIVGLQMIGAFTFGIGMAALRLRTNTIWPLMLLHAASDMFLAVGKLPVLLASPIEDTVLLIFGIVLIVGMLRKQRAKTEMAEPLNTDEPVA